MPIFPQDAKRRDRGVKMLTDAYYNPELKSPLTQGKKVPHRCQNKYWHKFLIKYDFDTCLDFEKHMTGTGIHIYERKERDLENEDWGPSLRITLNNIR